MEKGMVPSYCVSLPHYLFLGFPYINIIVGGRKYMLLALLNSMKYLKMVNGKKFLMVFPQTKIG